MENRSILYIDPNDVWAGMLSDAVGTGMEIVRARSAEEAQRVIARREKIFDAVVIGTFDVRLVVWLKKSCQCPIVAAAWLPRDIESLMKFGCTHRVPWKESTDMFLNSLFEL